MKKVTLKRSQTTSAKMQHSESHFNAKRVGHGASEAKNLSPIEQMDAAARIAQKKFNRLDDEVQEVMREFFQQNLKAGYKRLGKIIRGVDWTKKKATRRDSDEDDE